MKRLLGSILALALAASSLADAAVPAAAADASPASLPDPYALVAAAIDHNRGLTSYVEMAMLVHRPDWRRRSALEAWTRGRTDALVRFTAPPRDAGNATLRNRERMWTYTPKLNRVVRLPFSLMSQSWAGSDFSYTDLSRTDDLLNFYRLVLAEVGEVEGRRVYRIDAFPLDNAPVVWGKEEWLLRDDHVLLSQTFFDQEMQPLKRLEALDIRELGGRQMGVRVRMSKLDEADHYTEIEYLNAQFDLALPDSLFTTFSLQSGGRGG